MTRTIQCLLVLSILAGCSTAENRSVNNSTEKLWWQISTVTSDVASVQSKNPWLVNTEGLEKEDYPNCNSRETLVFPEGWQPAPSQKDQKEDKKEESTPKGQYY